MPYSSDAGKEYIDWRLSVITTGKPTGWVLDVGCGSGTYHNRYANNWLKGYKWVGVEVWEPYVDKFKLAEKYDTLIIKDISNFWKDHNGGIFDICFFGDVLEHMSKEDAVWNVEQALKYADNVIISIPCGYYPQDEFEGNPYERHVKDDWTMQEALDTFPSIVSYEQKEEIGVLVCRDLARIFRERSVRALSS